MNKYPDWLPEHLKDRFDGARKGKPQNKFEHTLLILNPNYISVQREEMKVGEEYIFGRPITSGEHEGHIYWSEFTPKSQKEIDEKHYHFMWLAYKKKDAP